MFEKTKEALRARVQPTSVHLAALRGDLQNRLQHFKTHRAPAEQDALEQDFALVLHAWGIEDAALIPAVLRELRLRILIFTLPVVLCAVLAVLMPWPAAWLPLVLVSPPCLLGTVITLWRVSVLTRKQYQPFMCWLCSFLGFTQKGA